MHKWTTFLLWLVLAIAPFLSTPLLAQVVITEPLEIAASDTTYDGQDVTVDGVEVVIDGYHQLASLRLVNGAALTHSEESGIELDIETELYVDEASRIDVEGKGLLSKETDGCCVTGSHGGRGGVYGNALYNEEEGVYYPSEPSSEYGSYATPETLGEGAKTYGRYGNGQPYATRGGGRVKVFAQSIVLQGRVSANGAAIQDNNKTHGAGGSVWFDADEIILGSSSQTHITANGGGAEGGSGGGRVAIHYSSFEYTLENFSVSGGNEFNNIPSTMSGGAGTVYLYDKSKQHGKLIVKNNVWEKAPHTRVSLENDVHELLVSGSETALEVLASDFTLNGVPTVSVSLLDQGRLIVQGDLVFPEALQLELELPEAPEGESLTFDLEEGHLEVFGELEVNAPISFGEVSANRLVVNNTFSWLSATINHLILNHPLASEVQDSVLSVSESISADENSLVVNGFRLWLGFDADFEALSVVNGGMISTTPVDREAGEKFKTLNLVANTLWIDSDSSISSGDRGFLERSPDVGPYGIDCSDYKEPICPGVGNNQLHSQGGGAIHLSLESLQIDGIIDASSSYGGGSIWIITKEISSTVEDSKITANSVYEGFSSGSVSLHYETNSGFDFTNITSNNKSIRSYAEKLRPGTVFILNTVSGESTLKISDGGTNDLWPFPDIDSDTQLVVEAANFSYSGDVRGQEWDLISGSLVSFTSGQNLSNFHSFNIVDSTLRFEQGLTFPEESPVLGSGVSVEVLGPPVFEGDSLRVDGFDLSLSGHVELEDISVINGGILSASKFGLDGRLSLVTNRLHIDEQSRIDVSGKGFPWSQENLDSGVGGSHGGVGGYYLNSRDERFDSLPASGDEFWPTTPGWGSRDSYGGGALSIEAMVVELGGQILADGWTRPGLPSNARGGSAGGSILLNVNELAVLSDQALIRASGSHARGGGGGGGRIAIYYSSLMESFPLLLEAQGGVSEFYNGQYYSYGHGEDGTVYLKQKETGPYVTSSSLNAVSKDAFRIITLALSEPIDPATVTANDLTLENIESGVVMHPDQLLPDSVSDLRAEFSQDIPDGSYFLTLAPSIANLSGVLLDQNQNQIAGQTPEDHYTEHFVVDTVAPDAPVLGPYPDTTGNRTITFSGSKEAGTTLWVNNAPVDGFRDAEAWQYSAELIEGQNFLSFYLVDEAGNESGQVEIAVNYDSSLGSTIAPALVEELLWIQGDGSRIVVDWSSYDPLGNENDISGYHVYYSGAPFSSYNSGVNAIFVPANSQSFDISGLPPFSTVYVVVVAIDTQGLTSEFYESVPIDLVDEELPGRAKNLTVLPDYTSLLLTWTPASDPYDNLDIYQVLVGDEVFVVDPTEIQDGFFHLEVSGLWPASAYPVEVRALNPRGNYSAAATDPGATLLGNPSDVSISDDYVLTWSASGPRELVSSYRIYAAPQSFTSVLGMEPIRIVPSSGPTQADYSLQLNQLPENTLHYFTVVAVNVSGGSSETIFTDSGLYLTDNLGPTIDFAELVNNGHHHDLSAFPTVAKNSSLVASFSDNTGVSHVVVYLNDAILGNFPLSTSEIHLPVNIQALADGTHVIALDVYDTSGNVSSVTYEFSVELSQPEAPLIITSSSSVTNNSRMLIEGKSEPYADVRLVVNGAEQTAAAIADQSGYFSQFAQLREGENIVQAVASFSGRGRWSFLSEGVVVIKDTSIPDAPKTLKSLSVSGGRVKLYWGSSGGQVDGYNIYRGASIFSQPEAAEKINEEVLTAREFEDVLMEDGTYYYAVSAQNSLGTESSLSNIVEASVDSTGPVANLIEYEFYGHPTGEPFRFSQGRIDLRVRFSEPLRNDPYLAFRASGSLFPLVVDLTRDYQDDSLYVGSVTLDDQVSSATYYAVMSAYDAAGNRGTQVVEGGVIEIDAAGPDALSLALLPEEPIDVDATREVELTLTVSEPTAGDQLPHLKPYIDGVPLAAYSEGIELTKMPGSNDWHGKITLTESDFPSDSTVASLSFVYRAEDAYGNASSRIRGNSVFQIYMGELPPAGIPQGLEARSKPAGDVGLKWREEPDASNYRIYRRPYGSTALEIIGTADGLTFNDTPSQDGRYEYAVSSLRFKNEQHSESALTETVAVYSDRIPPPDPTGLSLNLTGAGILAAWNSAGDQTSQPHSEQMRHRLYRLRESGSPVSVTSELTPIIDNIVGLMALDEKPSNDEHNYFVTAIDHAGNESLPSNTEYLNVDLLPVSNFDIVFSALGVPTLSWEHSSSSVSYFALHRTVDDVAVDLGVVTNHPGSHSFVDQQFRYQPGSASLDYAVVAVDENSVASLANKVRVPSLSLSPVDDEVLLQRGVFNTLTFKVTNLGDEPLTGIQLSVTIDVGGELKEHFSETVSLGGGETKPVSVTVGGYTALNDQVTLETKLIYQLSEQSTVAFTETLDVPVENASLRYNFTVNELVRGGSAKVAFTVENTSSAPVELLTARADGQEPSEEIILRIEDISGNVLAEKQLQQFTGGVLNVGSGHVVARVQPGQSFTSVPVDIPIPEAAPEDIKLRLNVKTYRLNTGGKNPLSISGSGLVKPYRLADVAYTAVVDSVSPEQVYGSQSVVVAGRALSTNEAPLANVPVKLVFSVRGFEEEVTVFSDASGHFSYDYEGAGSAGIYTVSALHPDITTRPAHGSFTIVGASAWPEEARVSIPRNYEHTIPLEITASPGAVLTNVRLRLLPPLGEAAPQLPGGLSVSHYPLEEVASGTTQFLNLEMYADNSAADTGTLRFAVEADNFIGPNAIGYFSIRYALSAARPALVSEPFYLDTGVTLGSNITETLTLTNMGAQTLHNARVTVSGKEGASLPDWVTLVSTSALGEITSGGKKQVQISFAPPSNASVGNYEFYLTASGDNSEEQSFPLFVTVTDARTGNAFFHASDIYTATLTPAGELIEGLSGAKISLQNEQVLFETFELSTNELGEAFFEGIPAGRYHFRASAFDHESTSGRVWVKPGVTVSEDVFLQNSLINVEWSVNEITIEDRYEITIEATFETNVPAAVVLLEPLRINLPVMEKGQVYQGELTLTNYGLVRAINVARSVTFPEHVMQMEFLREVPSTLEAGERVVLPYRIEAVRDFDVDAQDLASGGGCGKVAGGVSVSYNYECANDSVATGNAQTSVGSNWGSGSGCGGGSDSGVDSTGGFWGTERPRVDDVGDSGDYYWCKNDTVCDEDNCDNTSAK
ncbi:hypothetical protein [Gilvimarinus algae]|uniref:Fibronectin type-III domain-containing protein n=1 Tax=Gilvimarinus algae TaxID=3058037 RepID=A0ABT8TLM0_9GAMM|nr:hypothetical protein [Gilvimarinus sp. SDUM040014]MDO3383998.1 hypothetical protein [Gilvimarinus sp. SDUM040014]